ncbi:hypothetical protein VZT92_005856 [Zoarces viviparus]|uniref:Uncharacterized protein n=1 Tax=Zoarces viviparus TaxID=48416 RepID=A0AAW1FN85_ZOAVI
MPSERSTSGCRQMDGPQTLVPVVLGGLVILLKYRRSSANRPSDRDEVSTCCKQCGMTQLLTGPCSWFHLCSTKRIPTRIALSSERRRFPRCRWLTIKVIRCPHQTLTAAICQPGLQRGRFFLHPLCTLTVGHI